ncbi:MAG: ATP-binding protein, partial [Gammaproteobacteria bacterium]|nr:ATP-binding protein [Gammaproteobacteria bacterium]
LVVEESGTFKKKKSKVPQVVPDSQLIRSKDLNNISSQIRQPLNNILSTLSLLGASGLNKKQDEYLEQLTKSSEWISELLNQITDYAALRKGRLRLESANFDVRDVLNEVSSILSVESYKKGIQVQAVVNFDVPDTLIGDPTRVRYILLNLVGNAIRSAEQGDISVTVSTKKGKDDTVKLRIEIAESGIGVETEFAYTIFTEFERAEVITETDAAHSSMYFNLSRLLVNLMGGEVGYMDNALGGNTFWLDLPFKVPNTGQVSNARTLLFGQRALIVAKSEKNRKSIATILTNWGISCHTSNDPLAAQEKINRAKEMGNPYTILFVDVSSRAPVDHVVKMLEEVNLSQVMKNGAVFMLASKDLMGDDQVRQALGVDAIVYKPVNRQILKEELLRAVKPLSTGMQQSTLAPSSNLSLESEPGTDVETRVLILESDQAHQKVLSSIIGEFGIEVDVASESADAFAALQLKSYDMVLVDYELPEVSASYIAKKIRKLEVTSGKNGGLDGETSVRTNIVFLIDRELEGKRDKLLEQGADDTLIKPVTSALMSQFLSKWDLIMPDSENDAFMMTGSN